ncbi:MAG: hypothetical protein M9938_09280 [Solirubrobacterales bacterium]|nr:hypothetical protein [Solirubrobacterales bacterium]
MIGGGGDREDPAIREVSLSDALIPIFSLVVLVGGSIALFGLDALDGPVQVAMVLCTVIAGDQYIALVLPSRVFRAEFKKRDLAPTNLSRLAADSGTVTSPLVPWNSCGAFMAGVLGVGTLAYLPYCIFNYASPALSVLYGFTGFKIEKLQEETG